MFRQSIKKARKAIGLPLSAGSYSSLSRYTKIAIILNISKNFSMAMRA